MTKCQQTVMCVSEYCDDDHTIYRAHHDYRGNGVWHDWAWVSYQKDNAAEGYANVPAKILCFLPNGVPDDEDCHAVVHACKWQKKRETNLVAKWTMVPPAEATYNDIPYDVVPVTSLMGHCLVIPDLMEQGIVYEVLDKDKWSEKLY